MKKLPHDCSSVEKVIEKLVLLSAVICRDHVNYLTNRIVIYMFLQ